MKQIIELKKHIYFLEKEYMLTQNIKVAREILQRKQELSIMYQIEKKS